MWVPATFAEGDLGLTDVTTGDVSITKHGLVPKAPNDTTKFLRGDATWATNASTVPSPAFVAPPLGPTGTVNWAANTANYVRVYLPASFTVTKFNVYIGVSSGNIDVGIYSDSGGLPVTRLWSRGGVASPGTGQQSFLVSAGSPASLTLSAGTYWLAIAADNATITMATIVSGSTIIAAGLLAQQLTAYPLPATAGAAASAQGVHAVLV